MREPEDLNPPLPQWAESLRDIQLAPLRESALSIGYRAGLRAGRRRSMAWRAAAAVAILVAGGLFIRGRGIPPAVERVVYVQVQSPSAASQQASASLDQQYLRMCNEAIAEDELHGSSPHHSEIYQQNYLPPSRSQDFGGLLLNGGDGS